MRAEIARAGHSQTSFAGKWGRTQQFLSRRLSGQVSFSIAELEQIAAELGVPMATLTATEAVSV
ncbi:helix-turn-helix domain-containing protein [Mycolicibacterium mucogenicum]|uniref:Helix-turn-helix transcriptional regulator n=1 Tax=Mycolicibacterium mucogenicum DSM 44124 TaxID=1226753 RepID=A0A8H2JGB8_MYCMU|nr:helix-turn-helix transcriptional regulator [Mycolicibacterium mucogenicum]QPG69124.1 helix-turn-helix transcriptional regulator [Mycolicibacterium mucogenicum DSM 44124]